jgi:hypothetical protein
LWTLDQKQFLAAILNSGAILFFGALLYFFYFFRIKIYKLHVKHNIKSLLAYGTVFSYSGSPSENDARDVSAVCFKGFSGYKKSK